MHLGAKLSSSYYGTFWTVFTLFKSVFFHLKPVKSSLYFFNDLIHDIGSTLLIIIVTISIIIYVKIAIIIMTIKRFELQDRNSHPNQTCLKASASMH